MGPKKAMYITKNNNHCNLESVLERMFWEKDYMHLTAECCRMTGVAYYYAGNLTTHARIEIQDSSGVSSDESQAEPTI